VNADLTSNLYDRPVLVLDPGMHTAPIRRADVDCDCRFAVTGSEDKTLRVWSVADGRLLRTIRMPNGPGNIGKVFAVAMSPDGTTIAAGGWTRWTEEEHAVHRILLFDRETGAMTGRIAGLWSPCHHLAFSRDGNRLVAALENGMMLFAQAERGSWHPVAADLNYFGLCNAAAFAPEGGLAVASVDGGVRLYDAAGNLIDLVETHACPGSLAYHPKDDRLAVGCVFSSEVLLLDGATLQQCLSSDVAGAGNLCTVTWSADGELLFAAGTYGDADHGRRVIAWDCDAKQCRDVPTGRDTVMSLQALPAGALLVAAQDPWLAVIEANREPRWTRLPMQMDARGQRSNFAVSSDGLLVEFGLRLWGGDRLRFDVAALKQLPPADDGRVARPVQHALAVADWEDSDVPTLEGVPLPLAPHEIARSLAIHPDGDRFVLGTDWWLRAFDKTGAGLWQRSVPGVVWALNISGDGRLAVAGYGDGTIRWHRMDDGVELLALFPMLDKENWVVWTPEGIYAASPGARGVLRWHVNHGWDAAADAIPVSAIPETYRPEVIPHVLPLLDHLEAIKVAELAKIRAAIQRETGSDVPPGARLHVLAIGVSDYGAAARHLDLVHAHRDARDLAAALRSSQSSLYAQVSVSELVDGEATRAAILGELRAMRDAMARGTDDLAIVLFSGHGTMVDDDQFMLLPHGVDTSSRDGLEASALPATQFHDRIAALAQHGRVILLLDACRSGGATAPTDRSLRAMLKAPNVTIFTSSSAGELSVEDDAWENGAFTEALLEALRRGDPDRDGLICVSDLTGYLTRRIPELTGGGQRPDVEVHFDGRILVATG